MVLKKFKQGILIILAMAFLVSCSSDKNSLGKTSTGESATNTTESTYKNIVPTLFIHGYSGTENSFGGMIKRFEKEGFANKELVMTVSPEGEISQKGEISWEKENPMVQVIFENNEADEWSQASWIRTCIVYLKKDYGVDSVNIVAHSMGGASTFRYLMDYEGSDGYVVNKFVAIGTPFNNFVNLQKDETLDDVLKNGPVLKSERYSSYEKGVGNVSKDIQVLLVAGDVEDGSLGDTAVPMADALSVAHLFESNGNTVKHKEIYGKSGQHSKLHENDEVDKLVAEFLWSK